MGTNNDAIEIGLDEIRVARAAGATTVQHTPIVRSAYLSELLGGKVVLKAENLQRTGVFKIRGALNKVSRLGDAARNGVVTGSAGNHAQALALAAQLAGVRCEIFVPKGASLSKIAASRRFGAMVLEGGDSVDSAINMALTRGAEAKMAFCHPFDDIDVVAGQGTLGLELLEDIDDLAQVIVPLGGGGLLSGVAIALKLQKPSIRVIGVQISSCAPYIYGEIAPGPVPTLADGIAVKKPGIITRPLVDKWVDEIVAVDENSVADAMMLLMEHSRLFVEGGGAVGVSALLSGRVTPEKTGTTCVVLSGGNVDLGLIPNLIRRHETKADRRLIVFTRLPDRPGGLARLLTIFANMDANLIEVQHVREGLDFAVRETGVQITVEVRGAEHADSILNAAKAEGYEISAITGR